MPNILFLIKVIYKTLNGYILFNTYSIVIYFGKIDLETDMYFRKASMALYNENDLVKPFVTLFMDSHFSNQRLYFFQHLIAA